MTKIKDFIENPELIKKVDFIVDMKCDECNQHFKAQKNHIRVMLNHLEIYKLDIIKPIMTFCSYWCRKSYHKNLNPKISNTCLICDTKIPINKSYCDKHKPVENFVDKMTLENAPYENENKRIQPAKYSRIWTKSRRITQKLVKDGLIDFCCVICGYNKFVDTCHIIPIKNFPKNTEIGIINSLENLILLCPNHHKELDAGFFKPDGKSIAQLIKK